MGGRDTVLGGVSVGGVHAVVVGLTKARCCLSSPSPLHWAPGSSSGLHHDFHDNLYVLLRGTKRFRLFPPALAARMYTAGTLRAIYPNGRIVYEGQGEVLPDGTGANTHAQSALHHDVMGHCSTLPPKPTVCTEACQCCVAYALPYSCCCTLCCDAPCVHCL